MKIFLLLILSVLVVSSCHKRVKTSDDVYLVFRNSDGKVILTEEVKVDASRRSYMVLDAKSVSESFFLEKSDGDYSGDFEMYRFDEGDYDLSITLSRKGLGAVKMKGSYSGVVDELSNGFYTGQQSSVSGTIELRD